MSEWLLSLHNPYVIALILSFALMGGAVGLPIPEDIPLILAGVLVHAESLQPLVALGVCYLGVTIGDLIVFLLGRKFGPSLFETKWFKSRFPPRRVTDIRHTLERKSLLTIFIARHLFYLRTATFLTCGAVKMNIWRFLIADALAALISVPLMIGIGYKCAEHYEAALEFLSKAKNWSLVLAALIIAVLLFARWRRQRRKVAKAATTE